MSSEIILDIGNPWQLLKIEVSREVVKANFDLKLLYTSDENELYISLRGCKEFDIIENLLESVRVCFSKETKTQKEYGTIYIECFTGESYSEYWCDEFEKS